ncbi:MAG: enoyl-CoA hydratase-related protein [Rhodothermales bacterium]
MSFETIEVTEPVAGIVVCTVSRPEHRNALNERTVDEVRSVLRESAHRSTRPVIIFAGNEKVFVSGADINELRDRNKYDAMRRINNGLFHDIENYQGITIAAVRGYALGGGCELAATCDFRVVGKRARFGQPEVGLGIMPGAGATYRLPRIIGLAHAKDLILTGRIINADEADRMGFVSRLVEDSRVLEGAIELAEIIRRQGHLAVEFSKMALNRWTEMSIATGMLLESSIQAVLFEDEEKKKRMTDFLEKKK